ncbi:hypothetical protein AB9M75_07980 [Lactobacillus sp. AN1001]
MNTEDYLFVYMHSLRIIRENAPCAEKDVIDKIVINKKFKEIFYKYGIETIKREIEIIFQNMISDGVVVGKMTKPQFIFQRVTTDGYKLLEAKEDKTTWNRVVDSVKKEAPLMVASEFVKQIILRVFNLF